MASLEEPAFVVADTKKEEKNKRREARNKAIEEEKRRKKEEEHQKETERLRMQVDLHRNKYHHNVKQQLSQHPATHVPPVALAKSHINCHSQSQAPKALVKANVTRVPAAWAKAAPIINGHSQFQASNAPAETPIPTASAKPSSTTAISHHKQQPTSTAGSTEMAFFVGQIPVKRPTSIQPKNVALFENKNETQATVVETQQVQEGVNVMTYASALQKKKAAEAQENQGNNNNVTTTLPVQKENSAPHKKTTNHVSNEVRDSQYQAAQKGLHVSNVSSERSYYSGPGRTSNGPESPDQRYYGNGRRIGGNGSGQKYYGNGRRVTSGNDSGQRYYGNGRVANGSGQENQKKQAKPKPVIDAEGWQLVEYQSGRRGERV